MWVAGLGMPVLMATLLLLAKSSIMANAGQSTTATAEVTIDNFTFRPQTLTVAVGATVTWTNRDDIPPNGGERQRRIQVQSSGYRRDVFLHV